MKRKLLKDYIMPINRFIKIRASVYLIPFEKHVSIKTLRKMFLEQDECRFY